MIEGRSLISRPWFAATVCAVVATVAIVIVLQRDEPEAPALRTDWYEMYNRGTTDLESGQFREAAQTFDDVARGTRDEPKLAALHRAAAHDYVRAYIEIGVTALAPTIFQRVAADQALDMLESLAELYVSRGQTAVAIGVYQDLVARARTHARACLWQYNVAHGHVSIGTSGDVTVREIARLVRHARAGNDAWSPDERKDCHDNAAAMSGELARAYHNKAAVTRSDETVGYAEQLYELYLGAFPDAADVAMTRYYHAELLWLHATATTSADPLAERWRRAAEAFAVVVATHDVEAKLLKESAYASVLAWKNALNAEPDAEPGPPARGPDAIPDTTRRLLAAIDAYVLVVDNANDGDAIGMQFIAASTYLRYHHDDEAIPRLEELLAHHRGHETAEHAANLLVLRLHGLGREDELHAVIDSLVASRTFQHGEHGAWLAELRSLGIATERKR